MPANNETYERVTERIVAALASSFSGRWPREPWAELDALFAGIYLRTVCKCNICTQLLIVDTVRSARLRDSYGLGVPLCARAALQAMRQRS